MLTKDDIIEAYERMGVKKGNVLCVQGSYKGLGGLEGGPSAFANALMELLGEEGTLLMPAYNFESWTEKHYFDINETPSLVGVLTEEFRKMNGVERTAHPIHSLSVWGKLTQEICSLDGKNTFGDVSVFRYLLNINAYYSVAGLGLEMPFLPCHLPEMEMKTPYRRVKNFGGIYLDKKGEASIRSYCFNVRKELYRDKEAPIFFTHKLLYEMNALQKGEYKGVNFWIGSARGYHHSLLRLIEENPTLFGWE